MRARLIMYIPQIVEIKGIETVGYNSSQVINIPFDIWIVKFEFKRLKVIEMKPSISRYMRRKYVPCIEKT